MAPYSDHQLRIKDLFPSFIPHLSILLEKRVVDQMFGKQA